jgi:hypothetical protein
MFNCIPNYLHTCPPVGIEFVAKSVTCPSQLPELSGLLRRDLPSYANRIFQRQRKIGEAVYTSMIAVSKAELDPLKIEHQEYTPVYPQASPSQLFITTLERQYNDKKTVDLEHFHWLFLSRTRKGWRLVTIYSRIGAREKYTNQPITPPMESSQTVIAQAIRTWLNDCHIGKINKD